MSATTETLDLFALRIGPILAEERGGNDRRPVVILINERPLIDIVRDKEVSLTHSEFRERSLAGEEPEGLRVTPGAYMYPTLETCRHPAGFFGSLSTLFVFESEDPEQDRLVVLDCECGTGGCWPLTVHVDETEEHVVWSDVRQFHRPDWEYALGPWRFSKSHFERELRRLAAERAYER